MNEIEQDTKDRITRFKQQETVRLAIQANGAIHDCIEAGCIKDPQGNDPKVSGKAKRPALDQATQDLINSLKNS